MSIEDLVSYTARLSRLQVGGTLLWVFYGPRKGRSGV